MPRARTTYTAEYKLSAVKMITDQKHSVAEVARRLDVSETLLRAWRKVVLAINAAGFPGHGNPTPAEDELRRLRAENTRLRAERDLLKKPPRISPARRADVPVHCRQHRRVARLLDVRGAGPSPSGCGFAGSLGPRELVRQRALPAGAERRRDRVQHERRRPVLGQRPDGVVLRSPEVRGRTGPDVRHPRPGAGRTVRVPGSVLQPRPLALLAGVLIPRRV